MYGESIEAGPTSRRRRSAGAANAARILRAAEEVFSELGFAAASMSIIAQRAKVPKANVHYYFGSKEALYRGVLLSLIDLWRAATDVISEGADPAVSLSAYIRAKVEYSRLHPLASKIYANEVLHGAPHLREYFVGELRRRVRDKARIIQGWVDKGRIKPVDPMHLFFVIWASTQTYADFEPLLTALLGRKKLKAADYKSASDTIVQIVLHGVLNPPDEAGRCSSSKVISDTKVSPS
jgi:TetR/AcrR family transcriptional regulator